MRRFVRDAFFVRKYYEDGLATFKPAEVLSVQVIITYQLQLKRQEVLFLTGVILPVCQENLL